MWSVWPGSGESRREEQKQELLDLTGQEDDRHQPIALLVQMMTELTDALSRQQEEQQAGELHALSLTSSTSQPVTPLASALLFRDHRSDRQWPHSQPALLSTSAASAARQYGDGSAEPALQQLRLTLLREAFRLLSHLILSSVPSPLPPSATGGRTPAPPLSLMRHLACCEHELLTLLSALLSSQERTLTGIRSEVDALRVTLLDKRLLERDDDERAEAAMHDAQRQPR